MRGQERQELLEIARIGFERLRRQPLLAAQVLTPRLDLIERALATDLKEIKADPKLEVATQIEIGYQGLTLNLANGDAGKNGPFGKDPRVRQALEASIDRKALSDVVFNGEVLPGNQWVSPRNPYYQQQFPVPGRDLAKAKKLLADAGVATPVAVDFMVPNNPESRQVAEVIQAMAKDAGFDMKIRVTEFATSLKESEQGRFQAFFIGWSGRVASKGLETKTIESDTISYVVTDLPKEDYDEYYNGFANRVLWPILHYRLDLAEFTRRDLSGYLRVNDHFANELQKVLLPDDAIWVHDYHFFPFAKALRERGHKGKIGFFLHTPFPPPEIITAPKASASAQPTAVCKRIKAVIKTARPIPTSTIFHI